MRMTGALKLIFGILAGGAKAGRGGRPALAWTPGGAPIPGGIIPGAPGDVSLQYQRFYATNKITYQQSQEARPCLEEHQAFLGRPHSPEVDCIGLRICQSSSSMCRHQQERLTWII